MQRSNGTKQNQLLYREVNKRIREVGDSFGSDGSVQFLCECGQEECTATVELTQAQFDGFLTDPNRILLAAQHRTSANGARVVAEYDRFVIVSVGT